MAASLTDSFEPKKISAVPEKSEAGVKPEEAIEKEANELMNSLEDNVEGANRQVRKIVKSFEESGSSKRDPRKDVYDDDVENMKSIQEIIKGEKYAEKIGFDGKMI